MANQAPNQDPTEPSSLQPPNQNFPTINTRPRNATSSSETTTNTSSLNEINSIQPVKTVDSTSLLTAGVKRQDSVESVQSRVINGKRVLGEDEAFEKTAYAWSNRKKWTLLTIVAICQTSMNFNAAVYSNAVEPLNEHFGIENARMGMVAFLVAYAFGCELWAPWSEELGRFKVMQSSLTCVNASIIICALATNFPTIIGGRVFGGLASAGGSVTLGMVADMFRTEDQQHAVLWASLWSCLGAVLGGIAGGPIEQYLPWRWNFYIQLIFSATTQVLHLLIAKESRATVLLDHEAKKRRTEGTDVAIYGPNEVRTFKERWQVKEILKTMWRPYHMLLTEPIVLFLSLLSGFADALIFMFFESYGIVFAQWNFTPSQISCVLVALAGAYILAYFSFFPIIRRHNQQRARGDTLSPETRLYWLLFLVLCLPIGLFGSAFVGTKSWVGVVVFTIPIGIANYAIYYATIDYMVASYGEYSASATGGNGFARDLLAGIAALYTAPMFKKLGIQKTYFLLFAFAALFCIPVYVFYHKGPSIRANSRFAAQLAEKKEVLAEKENEAGRQAPMLGGEVGVELREEAKDV